MLKPPPETQTTQEFQFLRSKERKEQYEMSPTNPNPLDREHTERRSKQGDEEEEEEEEERRESSERRRG